MGPRPQVIARPAECSASLLDEPCSLHARAILIQLRPDSSGRPSVVVMGACMTHLRSIRSWLSSTWVADEVDTYSVDMADLALSVLLDSMNDGGVTVLTGAGVA